MTLSLYDATIPSNLQILRAVAALLDTAESFATAQGIAPAELIDARLAPDMLPFGYQVKSCAVHSAGAIDGVREGTFSPDTSRWPTDFAGLRTILADAVATLEVIDPAEFAALAEADMLFVGAQLQMAFSGADFLLSFSQPNFYFHASIAYGILRNRGVPLGKRHFIGLPRMKR